jgi:hypothetical protein
LGLHSRTQALIGITAVILAYVALLAGAAAVLWALRNLTGLFLALGILALPGLISQYMVDCHKLDKQIVTLWAKPQDF